MAQEQEKVSGEENSPAGLEETSTEESESEAKIPVVTVVLQLLVPVVLVSVICAVISLCCKRKKQIEELVRVVPTETVDTVPEIQSRNQAVNIPTF